LRLYSVLKIWDMNKSRREIRWRSSKPSLSPASWASAILARISAG
jgi:hypothetical protein